MLLLPQPVVESKSRGAGTSRKSTLGMLGADIPVIDLREAEAKNKIVRACKEFGFFKLVSHGVPQLEAMAARLEDEALKFFNLPQHEKDKAGPPNPFGYGNKAIGPNGDVGWVEYLLFTTNPDLISPTSALPPNSHLFRGLVNEYVGAVKNVTCEVLEKMAEGLKIGAAKNVFSRLIRDEKSDSCFRVNHYPPQPDFHGRRSSMIGFGEHTDPQVVSVGRSNNTTGLQISLRDGTWVSVPPDPRSLFVMVGDSLQVMTNGRFRSVKHRVVTGSAKPRVSMIYFGGPPLSEKIVPLTCLMEQGEESLYHEFSWSDYKKSAYKTKLSDNRLSLFEKNKFPTPPNPSSNNPSSTKFVL